MKKITIALVAAVLMSVSCVDAAVAPAKQPGMMSNMMNYGKKAMAGASKASKMGGQAVAGAKSMMAPKAPVANAPAAPAKPGMMSSMFNKAKAGAQQAAGAVRARMPGQKK